MSMNDDILKVLVSEEELKAIDPNSEASAINFRFQLQDYVRN